MAQAYDGVHHERSRQQQGFRIITTGVRQLLPGVQHLPYQIATDQSRLDQMTFNNDFASQTHPQTSNYITSDLQNVTDSEPDDVAITREEENFARLCLLIKGVAPKAVRQKFDSLLPPTKLTEVIRSNLSNLNELLNKRILNRYQMQLLNPGEGKRCTSESYDISLMTLLLRNITDLESPQQGWDIRPLEDDKSVGADLSRIRYYRNEFVHMENGVVETKRFEELWSELSEVISRLGGHSFVDKCKQMKVKRLQNAVPWNLKDIIDKELKQWEHEDALFVETFCSKFILQRILMEKFVTIIGNSGAGKTATMHHICLLMRENGYEIIPVNTPDEIINFYNPDLPTVFTCDNFCGEYNIDSHSLQSWKLRLNKLQIIAENPVTNIIVACRSIISHDKRFKLIPLFNRCICDFSSPVIRLSDNEKYRIATAYIPNPKHAKEVWKHRKSDFFPLVCCLINRRYQTDVLSKKKIDNRLIHNPFSMYEHELDQIILEGGNSMYCALALCVLYNNDIHQMYFDVSHEEENNEMQRMIDYLCNACKLIKGTPSSIIHDELVKLEGSYVIKRRECYSTIHDKLFEFLVHYFISRCPREIVNHASCDLISQRVIYSIALEEKENTILPVIPSNFQSKYIERVVYDWKDCYLQQVSANHNFRYEDFKSDFITYLNTLAESGRKDLVHISDKDENTILMHCCMLDNECLLNWVLSQQSDINRVNNEGASALFFACQKGNINSVSRLLHKGSSMEGKTQNASSLYDVAKQNGNKEVSQLIRLTAAQTEKRAIKKIVMRDFLVCLLTALVTILLSPLLFLMCWFLQALITMFMVFALCQYFFYCSLQTTLVLARITFYLAAELFAQLLKKLKLR